MFSLHAHSNYSLLSGAVTIEKLIGFAKKTGSGYVSLTDENSMAGLIKFAKVAIAEKIKPILGTQIKLGEESVVLIAKNNLGYSEICKIITAKNLKSDFSIYEMLSKVSANIIVIINSIDILKNLTDKGIPLENTYAELIISEKAKKNTRQLFNFAKENKIKIMASNPVYFEKKEDYIIHKALTAIRLNKTIANLTEDEIEDPEYYLKSPEELNNIWKAVPEAMWNTDEIARECNVDLEFNKYKFPEFNLNAEETAFSYLWKVSFKGLSERVKPITEKAVKRLQYELEVIDDLGFLDYFLVVWDIVREAKTRKMVTIGRGSAANSLVAYCLGFTQINPLDYDLYFERFMNRGRLSPPDVDLDFSWKERDRLVRYIFEKYGYDKVAMISTTVTFRARSAFREIAKVFGISESEISKYSRLIPWTSAENLPILAQKFPESRKLDFNNEPWKSIIEIASKIASFPRHLSIHPSGIVITKEPITNYVALEYAGNKGLGIIITQPDMYSIEDLGLIKIDLLSQRSLGVLRDTLDKVQRLHNKNKITKIRQTTPINIYKLDTRK